MAKKQAKATTRSRWLKPLLIAAAVALALAAADLAYGNAYDGKTFPNVQLGPVAAGGQAASQIHAQLQAAVDSFELKGITLQARQRKVALLPTVGRDADVSYSWVETDVDASVAKAMSYGRSGSWLQQRWERLASLIHPPRLMLVQTLTRPQLRRAMEQAIGRDLQALTPALVHVAADGSVTISDSKAGETWGYDAAVDAAAKLSAQLSSSRIIVEAHYEQPEVEASEVTPALRTRAEQLLATAPLTFTYGDRSWGATATTVASWLRFAKSNGSVHMTIDKPTVELYVANAIAADVNQPASAIKFTIANGKAAEFQPSQEGRQLDQPGTVAAVAQRVDAGKLEPIALDVRVEPAPESGDTTQVGSIRELVATGHSNFKGSPVNRRHNIAVGAAAVNGTLIQPGEEFSLLKTLGAIDASTGYLPELVIKGNKTTPEFGGGLCQIGTTAFRAALAVGVPITERRNHSYRVVYYEPAGTDATIYDPAPDFKFRNDYATPLLFQTRIDGDDLYFELWGAKDGRVATQTTPVISNVVVPAPTKIVETLDLKPGEKKCTEKAHNGADAKFTYNVTYPSGQTVTQDFKSHYVPWQAVCLLGVDHLSASSTEAEVPINP
jgi:vancomycin resistance protein YoaR